MQALRSFWAKSFLNKLVLLVVLPLLCCGGWVVVAQPGQSTVVIAVTVTPLPPTAGPSPTPGPTDTPEPSVVPEPTTLTEADPANRAYAEQMVKIGASLTDSLTRIGELTGDAKPDDQQWVADFAFQTVVVEQAHTDLQALDVPESATEMHAALLDATGNCDASVKLLRKGIDSRDGDTVRAAGALAASCNEKFDTAKPLLEAWVKDNL